ncbi:MAG TPA: tyrosine-type recombinase/integrase [Acidimicrobiia bacterium]|jgi:integrase/recombinase XerC|nr:tyrosine-type recombinase/integrase [Acidimicrobiia bacterium]
MSEPLAVLAEQWLAWKNTAKPSSATLKARRADLAALAEIIVGQLGLETTQEEDRFRRWLGALDPSHLDRETIISAFATYATSHAAASIRRCRSTWTGFCQWLVVHRQVLETNPVEFVEPPKARRWRPRPISEEDLARIVQAAQRPYEKARQPWPELEQALCALFVGAGLRVSEAISVRVGDVRRSPIELTKLFVTGKGGVTRTIPLPPEIVDVLDRYLESRKERLGPFQPTDPLILRPNGKPLTSNVVDHLVRGWFRRAGVAPPPGALAHSLRHTYATLLVENSGSVPEVQRLLGHADMATTQAYIDVTARGVEETAMANPARRMLGNR